ncbi:MAG: TrpR-like protein [Oscillospiraceae bacterium]|nr:TrpR-like protein [Oscillospiraceae bacterium]
MNKRIKKTRNLEMYKAILTLETVDEVMKFFEDLCTVSELQAMEQRFQVAVLLNDGLIYNDILERTGASSATISRVNRSLQYGADGYAVAFERLKKQEEENE